jgi:hypothetical protein
MSGESVSSGPEAEAEADEDEPEAEVNGKQEGKTTLEQEGVGAEVESRVEEREGVVTGQTVCP